MEDRRAEDRLDDDLPAGGGAPPPLRGLPPLPRAEPTDAELQAAIDEAVAVVYEAGMPAGRFTVQRVHEIGLTVEVFVKQARAVFGGKNVDQADLIFTTGIKMGVCGSLRTMEPAGFWEVIRWARSNVGRQALETGQKVKKVEDKRAGTQTPNEVALCQIFTMQQGIMAEEVKEARASTQQEIDELTRLLRLKRAEQVKVLAEIKDKYFPANIWEEPAEAERNARCWEVYSAALVTAGRPAPIKTEAAFKLAIDAYKNFVDTEFKTRFIRSDEHQVALRKFADERIHFLDGIGEPKKAGTFRSLLAVLGVEPSAQTTTHTEERNDEDDSGGESDVARGEEPEPEAGGGTSRPGASGRGAGRGKGKRKVVPERRSLRSSKTGRVTDVSVQGAQGDGGASRPKHRRR
ncbi:putative coat protein [Rhododendron virus A]|uniref:Putative coat protein n=1 Tax=Rhododendron virus A TaxID=878260 RepID=E1B261_9VIRU|nr:putative coat protein [Rhododendron virus A]ADM36021.1 putative coat protein [Rhododendron virus A]